MRAERNHDGTVTVSGMSTDTFYALLHLAGDLGEGTAVMRFDAKVYSKWARPKSKARRLLKEFARLDLHPDDWDYYFAVLAGPKFASRR
jgi:hypothetical protein